MTATFVTVDDRLLREVAAAAADVDAGRVSASARHAELAALGALDLGIEDLLAGRGSDIREQATVISAIAAECVATAFSVWAHRMVVDYFARGHRSAESEAVFADLRAGGVLGSTAMAAGLKSLAGIGDVEIRAVPYAGGWRLDGPVAWASNLVPGAIVVLPARTDDGRTVVGWVRVGDPGVTVRHITGLLALDATASGSLRLVDAEVSHQRVLSTDLPSYAAGFRPTFLVLQSAFIAGLMARSLREAEAALDRGENAVFAGDVTDLGREVDAWMTRWRTAAADTSAAPLRELLELRLAAAALASRATRIEATLAGGRGYVTTSGASRRFREAAFLPVQSPSEGHLRWELSSLA